MAYTKAFEFLNETDALNGSNDIHLWAIENIDGYSANKWADIYQLNNKFYVFVNERVSQYPLYLNAITLELPEIDIL